MKIKIYGGLECFHQGDKGQKLIVEDEEVNELHLTNLALKDAKEFPCYEENGIKLCDVPDYLLETAGALTIYACVAGNGKYTKGIFKIHVCGSKLRHGK